MRSRTADFHLRPFPKGVYLVVSSPASDQPLRFPRRFATATSHAHGAVLCRGTAPSSGRTLEIRATPPDSGLGETACTDLAKLARKDGIPFHTLTKTEVIALTGSSSPEVDIELQGPSGTVIGAGRRLRSYLTRTPGALAQIVPKAEGKESCTFHAGKLTFRFYGGKSPTGAFCGKGFRKTLPGG